MTKRTIVIKDVCDFNSETIGNVSQPEEIQYLDTGNITRNRIDNIQILNRNKTSFPSRAQRKVKDKTIIYSTVRPVQEHFGFLSKPADNFIVSTGFLTLDVKDQDVDPKFLYYALTQKNITAYLQTIATNNVSSYPSINPDDVGNLKIDIPKGKKQQQDIAAVLTAIDDKIELNHRINAELEAMAKTIYDYWFVQFDFPDKNGKPYKSSGGRMVWNEALKQDIPEGWEAKKIVDWISSDKNGDWGSDELKENNTLKVTCIRGTDIDGLNGTDFCNPPTRFILEKSSHKILNSHELIIEISGGAPTQSTGRLGYITDATLKRFDSPLICSNFCKAISLKNKKHLYNFVYHWNRLYDNGVFFGHEGKTSGIKNLLFDSFVKSHWIAEPNSELVETFYAFMQNIQEKKQTVLRESRTLMQLRDWLLPMLMNGQVKVN